MSQPGKQTIAIHTLLNISMSKCSQKMKFGQLTEHKKIFLKTSYTQCRVFPTGGQQFAHPPAPGKISPVDFPHQIFIPHHQWLILHPPPPPPLNKIFML